MDASEILKMRDEKFTEYFSRPQFIERIQKTFGSAVANIVEMNSKRLRRKIIEEAEGGQAEPDPFGSLPQSCENTVSYRACSNADHLM